MKFTLIKNKILHLCVGHAPELTLKWKKPCLSKTKFLLSCFQPYLFSSNCGQQMIEQDHQVHIGCICTNKFVTHSPKGLCPRTSQIPPTSSNSQTLWSAITADLRWGDRESQKADKLENFAVALQNFASPEAHRLFWQTSLQHLRKNMPRP